MLPFFILLWKVTTKKKKKLAPCFLLQVLDSIELPNMTKKGRIWRLATSQHQQHLMLLPQSPHLVVNGFRGEETRQAGIYMSIQQKFVRGLAEQQRRRNAYASGPIVG